MKIHEYQAKELFEKYGIPTSGGQVAANLQDAQKIADEAGFPVVLKAQVLVGGRGKAGGVKIAKDKKELEKYFKEISRLRIKGYRVEKILVVSAVEIKKEFYAAITVDSVKNDVVVIASSAGGIDIEETAKTHPEKILKYYLEGKKEIGLSRWPEFIHSVFADASLQEAGTKIFGNLLRLFFENDCSLAEINPLVLDERGQLIAVDAKINFDDNALFRHEENQRLADIKYEDPDEREAKEHGLSFIKMEGDVGCVVNGAGLAMATMDIVTLLGGKPANFLDVGGSSSPEKVLRALTIIMRNAKVKSILVNIFGGITRCDDIANGIVEAKNRIKFSVPMAVRLTGTNEEEAKEILAKHNIKLCSSMREAVEQAVKSARI